jgi:nucleoside-diphosphate-sugar epimerase
MDDLPALSPPSGAVAATGGTGRIARLLKPIWRNAVAWRSRSDGSLRGTLSGRRALIALGGVTRGDGSALAANTNAAIDALEAARADGVPRVLLMSSSTIYGRREGRLSEGMAPTPVSPYGAAKARMEAAVADWREAHPDGPEAVILRLGNVAGADALLGGLAPDRRPTLDTFPDGATPARSYVGPETLARLLTFLATAPAPLPPLLNAGTPALVEMGDLLREAGIDWESVPAPAAALRAVALDVTRLAGLFPFVPSMSDPAEMVAEWRRCTP